MRTVLDAIGALLPGLVVKGSLALLVGAVIVVAARRASAASKHLVWTAALAAVLVMPLAAAVLPTIGLPILPATTFPARVVAPVSSVAAQPSPAAQPSQPADAGVSQLESPVVADPEDRAPESTPTGLATSEGFDGPTRATHGGGSVATLAAVLWLSGFAVLLGRLAVGAAGIRRLVLSSAECENRRVLMSARRAGERVGLTRRVTMRVGSWACIPVTWGAISPTVLLPSEATRWDQERLDAVLLHELGHVQRLDAFTQMIAQLAVASFWFNPLVWLAARQARIERERACDDLVLASGARASRYADDLLALVVSLDAPRRSACAALAMARRTDLEGRVLAILEPMRNRRGITRTGAAWAAGLWIALVPVAAMQGLTPTAPFQLPVVARARQVPSARPDRTDRQPMAATTGDAARSGARQARSSVPDGQGGIPSVRPLGPIVAVATEPLTDISTIRALRDGRVLALDVRSRRVLLFDSSLVHFVSVVDTTNGPANADLPIWAWGALFPFHGDSSLFADYALLQFLVLDPAGRITRVMAAPPGPGGALTYLGGAYVDPQNNVVTQLGPIQAAAMAGDVSMRRFVVPTAPLNTVMSLDHSQVILRVNIETTQPTSAISVNFGTTYSLGGGTGPTTFLENPFPRQDFWTVMPDGTIAVVREYDYHIDWVAPDGSVTSSPNIQHEWVRLTDSAKAAMLDSVQRADSARLVAAKIQSDSAVAAARRAGQVVTFGPNGAPSIQNGHMHISLGPAANATVGPYVGVDQMPDSLPPFDRSDTLGIVVRADADGNVWIRARLPHRLEGGTVYDVVNRQGTLVDRIQLPGGTTLVGFMPRFAYLMFREGTGYKLERARIPARIPPG